MCCARCLASARWKRYIFRHRHTAFTLTLLYERSLVNQMASSLCVCTDAGVNTILMPRHLSLTHKCAWREFGASLLYQFACKLIDGSISYVFMELNAQSLFCHTSDECQWLIWNVIALQRQFSYLNCICEMIEMHIFGETKDIVPLFISILWYILFLLNHSHFRLFHPPYLVVH